MSAKDQARRDAREDRLLGVEEEALVANAADATQVKKARKTQRRARAQELEDIRDLLKSPGARRFLWRMLKQCRTFESVAGMHDAQTNYNAGRQDVGHFVFAEITAAQPDIVPQLMQQAYKEKK